MTFGCLPELKGRKRTRAHEDLNQNLKFIEKQTVNHFFPHLFYEVFKPSVSATGIFYTRKSRHPQRAFMSSLFRHNR